MAKKDKTPTTSYKPSVAAEDRLNESYTRFEGARDGREYVDKHFESYEKQWEGYFADDIEDQDRNTVEEYRSNVWVPMTYWLTMSAMAEPVGLRPCIPIIPAPPRAPP